ncbi:PREDICTED: psbP domain-containing protein 3, chloroplastic [Brassica oleracea var. oleracea]|uniref:psbP domain-containing protein 3, chloroplastic n=1 Tax=Brassica oleracea var. oleracea TaxID=109376 RepID=UPI0006A72785|nr:PREDICTED: psbP domain-containing protein 3, chloroplastic [Brassica oleracea var. oleracea]
MAAITPWLSSPQSFSNPRVSTRYSSRRCTSLPALVSAQEHHQIPCRDQVGMKRREVMLQLASSAFFLPFVVSPAFAETSIVASEAFRVYTDEANKFEISIPQDWQVGQAAEPNGFKSITAFYPEETSTYNVSVAITGLGPDFTRMESFGKVEAFAETLVSGLDRSWQKPAGVTAKLVDSRSSKGFYYIEYTLQNPGEARKHLYSAIGMATNGWYNRLYTVTGQFTDEESADQSSKIQKAVKSFKFI